MIISLMRPLGSMAPEQLVIGLLPFLLVVAAEHYWHDLSLSKHLADFGRIGRDIRPCRQAALMGHERLAFLAQDEVAGKPCGIRVRRQRIDADGTEDQRHRLEQPK